MKQSDQAVIQAITSRTQKFQAPEPIRPTGSFATRAETLDAFRQARDNTIAYVRETKDDLRNHFAPMPALARGEADAYQWFLLIAAHTERHLAQLKELSEQPGFPKR